MTGWPSTAQPVGCRASGGRGANSEIAEKLIANRAAQPYVLAGKEPTLMTTPAMLRVRAGVGLLLALAPAFPIFQTGRYSTLRGAAVTIAATALTVLMVWWTRRDPELESGGVRLILLGVLGGVSASVVVAYALGSELPTIVRFLWIPFLRAVAVSVGVCLMLSTLAFPMPVLPAEGDPGAPTLPQPRPS